MSNGMKIASWRASPPHPSGSSAPIARTGQSRAFDTARMLRERLPADRPRPGRPRYSAGCRWPRRARPRRSAGARSPWRRRRCSWPAAAACVLVRLGARVGLGEGSHDLVELARHRPRAAPRAPCGQHARAHAARALGDASGAARSAGRSASTKSGIAVVVQVLEILGRPSRRSRTSAEPRATARRARPSRRRRRGVARRARGRRRRRRRSAPGCAAGDAPEVDLDGREAVLAVEEAGRRASPLRCCSGSTKPSSRARRTPISHSASSSSWCALAWTRWPEVRPMRERT